MASVLTPKLPLIKDGLTGYVSITSYKELVRQNFKNLKNTIPGERTMDADFGVGLMRYLFELDNPGLYGKISARIKSQVSKYLPYIEITNIIYDSGATNQDIDFNNNLAVFVEYIILPLRTTDNISLTVATD